MQTSYSEEAFAQVSFDRASFEARGGSYDFAGETTARTTTDVRQIA
ncbi:MAG: hypothetical protein ACOYMN_05390 [Roseimicrobium sp.]|jgi:hypothetical protein